MLPPLGNGILILNDRKSLLPSSWTNTKQTLIHVVWVPCGSISLAISQTVPKIRNYDPSMPWEQWSSSKKNGTGAIRHAQMMQHNPSHRTNTQQGLRLTTLNHALARLMFPTMIYTPIYLQYLSNPQKYNMQSRSWYTFKLRDICECTEAFTLCWTLICPKRMPASPPGGNAYASFRHVTSEKCTFILQHKKLLWIPLMCLCSKVIFFMWFTLRHMVIGELLAYFCVSAGKPTVKPQFPLKPI